MLKRLSRVFSKSPVQEEQEKVVHCPPGGAPFSAAQGCTQGSDELVRVDVTPLKKHVLTGVANKVTILFNIVTAELPSTQAEERAPLNLAIVLDRSGSMRGPKLENAKLAIVKVIENMNTKDLIHLVVYGSKVKTVFENATLKNKSQLIVQVTSLRDEGCTNLSGGLEQGAALVNTHHKKGYAKRMYVFSDGLANEGIRSVEGISTLAKTIRKGGINIDSFGIGDDFDSAMMKNIAEYGSGEFFFIDSAGAIPQLVSKALKGLLEMVGSDTVLTLRGVGDGVVRKIYDKDDQALIDGAALGDLHQSNVRKVMAEIEVAPKEIGASTVLSWELSFAGRSAQEGQRTVLTGSLELVRTNDSLEVKNEEENVDVRVSLALQQAGDSDMTIEALLKAGNVQEACQEQSLQIERLEANIASDTSGMVKMVQTIAHKTLDKLKSQGASKEVQKRYKHGVYMKRRGSMNYCSNYS